MPKLTLVALSGEVFLGKEIPECNVGRSSTYLRALWERCNRGTKILIL